MYQLTKLSTCSTNLTAAWAIHESLTEPPPTPVTLLAAAGWTVGLDNKWGPPIPYPSVDHGDGEVNYGYMPTKGDPQAISKIPEVQGWPELEEFLKIVNAPASPLESVGCEKGFFDDTSRSPASVMLGAYVDVIFSEPSLATEPKPVLALVSQLVPAIEACSRWWAVVEFGVQLMHPANSYARWGLIIRPLNYGGSGCLFIPVLRNRGQPRAPCPPSLPAFTHSLQRL